MALEPQTESDNQRVCEFMVSRFLIFVQVVWELFYADVDVRLFVLFLPLNGYFMTFHFFFHNVLSLYGLGSIRWRL